MTLLTRRHARVATVALAAAALSGGVLAAGGVRAPHDTSETWTRPASDVFTVAGHGWGHGIGMSQYGAEGAALSGVALVKGRFVEHVHERHARH